MYFSSVWYKLNVLCAKKKYTNHKIMGKKNKKPMTCTNLANLFQKIQANGTTPFYANPK